MKIGRKRFDLSDLTFVGQRPGNPNWAILKHDGQALYWVCETNGTKDFLKLRTREADKVRCGLKPSECLSPSSEPRRRRSKPPYAKCWAGGYRTPDLGRGESVNTTEMGAQVENALADALDRRHSYHAV